jgi:integral membrane protein
MAPMTGAFDLRTVAGWFRLIALLEAVSWVGLLIGMYFKYLGSPRTEVGVQVFGMAHGLIFIAFVLAALLVGIASKWSVGTWLLALLAGIVPLCSVIFLIWADRTGRIGAAGVCESGRATGRVDTRNDVTDLGRDTSTSSSRARHSRCG